MRIAISSTAETSPARNRSGQAGMCKSKVRTLSLGAADLVEQRPGLRHDEQHTSVANTSMIHAGISTDIGPDQIDSDVRRDSWWRRCPRRSKCQAACARYQESGIA